MHKLVVDASIVLGWPVSKSKTAAHAALRLQDDAISGRKELHAPLFLLIEIINVLSKKYHIPISDIQSFIDQLRRIGIRFTIYYEDDMYDLLQTAVDYDLTAYDAHYVLLAKKLECKLITLDRKLLKLKDIAISVDEL